MLSGSQLKGSAFTSSRLITELLEREPEMPLRPVNEHKHTHSGVNITQLSQRHFCLSRVLTRIEELCVEHGHVVPTSCLDGK